MRKATVDAWADLKADIEALRVRKQRPANTISAKEMAEQAGVSDREAYKFLEAGVKAGTYKKTQYVVSGRATNLYSRV